MKFGTSPSQKGRSLCLGLGESALLPALQNRAGSLFPPNLPSQCSFLKTYMIVSSLFAPLKWPYVLSNVLLGILIGFCGLQWLRVGAGADGGSYCS